jgi:hypothetical protein
LTAATRAPIYRETTEAVIDPLRSCTTMIVTPSFGLLRPVCRFHFLNQPNEGTYAVGDPAIRGYRLERKDAMCAVLLVRRSSVCSAMGLAGLF